jgi:hypothetical protein
MKRKALLAFAAAGALTAIIVLTTGAFAGTSGRSDQPGDGAAALVSCLASHGVQVPSNDPAGVKQWLADHESDPAVKAAIDACAPADGGKGNADVSGPTPAELVACLEQHGVEVPSDVKDAPDTIKEWLHGAMEQASVKSALDAC